MRGVGALSYWHDSLAADDDLTPRPPLRGDTEVDVAIVGAGFTGLWTAHSLLRADPNLRVLVLERETAGFGASGRNGGWCVGMYSGPAGLVERRHGDGSYAAMSREMHRSVDEVGAAAAEAGIDCQFRKSGAINFAVNDGQRKRLRRLQRSLAGHGLGDAWRWLDAAEAEGIVHVEGIQGAVFSPHAAAIHPARLARGLAVEVERRGGTVAERTTVERIDGRRVRTDHGTVRADVVVRATEGYTRTLDGHRRDVLPLGNTVIATDPIDDATWAEIGLADRELFELGVHMVAYGNRTADGRIVWGGLGAPTWWASRIPTDPYDSDRVAAQLERSLVELFPALRGITVSHRWGGVMGVPFDLLPGIGYDRDTGFAWAGGYTGQGVATANAAGRGLADLILDRDTDLTRLPWVGHRSPRWPPEPVRWAGVHGVTAAARVADRRDGRRGLGRPPG